MDVDGICLLPAVSQVAAGGQHSLALTYDDQTGTGCVLSWGNNEYGQLGRNIEVGDTCLHTHMPVLIV
jgi:alpha-tubulin suppressor-like RCC1 family protein